MTVEEYLLAEKITDDVVAEWLPETDYGRGVSNFLSDNWAKDTNQLSPKQFAWLERIRDDLTEFRIENAI